MNILITGAAGFIGFNLALYLLNKNYKVYGIDNFDNYYSIPLKKKRIDVLKKNKKFIFEKINIINKNKLSSFFKKKKFDIIINLAAQAGVRYSLENPGKYIDVNVFGFINLIEEAKKNNIKKFIYASSSSVYGDSNNFPLKETENLYPKNIYAVSKKLNEEIADLHHKIDSTKFLGLRFFTVFGEWGRPDMFMLKLFKAHIKNKYFYLNNYGNHLRDFTYIGDVVKLIGKLLNKKFTRHEILNICSNNPININDIVNEFKKKNKLSVKLIEMHKADVLKTHGDNAKLKKFGLRIQYTPFYEAFFKTFEWYKKNNIYKY